MEDGPHWDEAGGNYSFRNDFMTILTKTVALIRSDPRMQKVLRDKNDRVEPKYFREIRVVKKER